MGVLDEDAFAQKLESEPDAALTMLADLVAATDPTLSELAQRLASRIFIELSARVGPTRPGVGRVVSRRSPDLAGDLDIDASTEVIVSHRATGVLAADELRHRVWTKNTHAISLVIDRSGSMGGAPLATAALAAAAVAHRRPTDYSILVFGSEVGVAKPQRNEVPTSQVVTSVLSLRGFGTTNLAEALRESAIQLAESTAKRRVTILLSDCRSTSVQSAEEVAQSLDELVVIAHSDDEEEAQAFARRVGARYASVCGPSDIPDALLTVLG